MSISVFDLFKIGIGPSSSHTMGPWKACRRFVQSLEQSGQLRDLDGVQVVLYGSLAKTGRGHGTAKAIQLGLMDMDPEHIEPRAIPELIAEVGRTGRLEVGGRHEVPFDLETDVVYRRDETLSYHANALAIRSRLQGGHKVEETYYSVGGGFIEKEGEDSSSGREESVLPYPASTGQKLLAYCQDEGWAISEVVRRNERTWRDEAFINERLDAIWDAMKTCVYRGCHAEEELRTMLH